MVNILILYQTPMGFGDSPKLANLKKLFFILKSTKIHFVLQTAKYLLPNIIFITVL